MKWILGIVSLLIIIAGVLVFVIPAKAPTVSNTTGAGTSATVEDEVMLMSPQPGDVVQSPLVLSGSVRGTWYFEGSFPIQLLDASGAVIAQTPAHAQGDWMKANDFVPLSATLTFVHQPSGSDGTLVLKNDNPSGDPANQKELDIPVVFK